MNYEISRIENELHEEFQGFRKSYTELHGVRHRVSRSESVISFDCY